MRFPIFLTIALTLAGNAAVAAQPDCSTSASTQLAIDQCVGRHMKAFDQKLNDTYRALLAKVSKEGEDRLRAAQRAWLTWRDAQCAFETMGTRGGSVNSSVYGMCIDKLTQEQTKRLDAQLHCEDGDLSCGGQ